MKRKKNECMSFSAGIEHLTIVRPSNKHVTVKGPNCSYHDKLAKKCSSIIRVMSSYQIKLVIEVECALLGETGDGINKENNIVLKTLTEAIEDGACDLQRSDHTCVDSYINTLVYFASFKVSIMTGYVMKCSTLADREHERIS